MLNCTVSVRRLDDADRHANADIVMQEVGRTLRHASNSIGVGEDVLFHLQAHFDAVARLVAGQPNLVLAIGAGHVENQTLDL